MQLLHHSGRFATNPEYFFFFAQFITEQKKVSDNINIAQKKSPRSIFNCFTNKIQCTNLTESHLSRSGIFTFATNPWYPTLLATI